MTILAAVDGEQKPDRVVTIGQDLAEAYGDDLVVLHVMPEDEFESIQQVVNQAERSWAEGFVPYFEGSDPPEGGYYLDRATEDAADMAEDVAQATLDGQLNVEAEGRVGDPVTEIINVAQDLDARYIVIGGRKRTPAGKALFGSATQSLLLNADRPVVTVMSED